MEISFFPYRIFYVDINKINPSSCQARKNYDPARLAKLAYSIKIHGMIQPVTLRKKDGAFELVAGERRIRAARMAGLSKVPAIIRKMHDQTAVRIALAENMQREDLSYFEQASCYRDYINNFNMSSDDLAQNNGQNCRDVELRLESLLFPEEVKSTLEKRGFDGRYNDALFITSDKDMQCRLMDEIVRKNMTPMQALEYASELIMGISSKPVRKGIVGDMKIYINTLIRSVGMIDKLGGTVETQVSNDGNYTEYKVKIKNSML